MYFRDILYNNKNTYKFTKSGIQIFIYYSDQWLILLFQKNETIFTDCFICTKHIWLKIYFESISETILIVWYFWNNICRKNKYWIYYVPLGTVIGTLFLHKLFLELDGFANYFYQSKLYIGYFLYIFSRFSINKTTCFVNGKSRKILKISNIHNYNNLTRTLPWWWLQICPLIIFGNVCYIIYYYIH